MSTIDSLRLVPVFGHLAEAQIEQLADCAAREAAPPKARLYEHEDSERDIFAVTRGSVRVQRNTPFGELVMSLHIQGELLGDREFVDGLGRSGDAVVDSAAELLRLDAARLAELAKSDASFNLALSWALWRSLSKGLRRANDKLIEFFGEKQPEATAAESSSGEPAGEKYRLEMIDKRTLFQEQKLSSMEINFLASLSREERFPSGAVICREGDPGDKMYVVLDGQVLISKFIPGAGEEALGFLARGDYFGEMALIDQEPRSAEARAHDGEAIVLAIPRNVVEGILDIKKVSSVRLLKILSGMVAHRLRETDEKLMGWHLLAGGNDS